ncbi:MAG: AraC family ligand binding domain-containing protein, partial [Planctomycetota bacterium]
MYIPAARRPGAAIERYFGREIPWRGLPALGRSAQKSARPALAAHRHPNGVEICRIERGAVDWFLDDRAVTLQAGDLFFTPAGAWHGNAQGVMQPCELRWVQVDPRWLGDKSLSARLKAVRAVAWPDRDGLDRPHELLLAECRRPRADSPAFLRAVVMEILLSVVRQAEALPEPSVVPPAAPAASAASAAPSPPASGAVLTPAGARRE